MKFSDLALRAAGIPEIYSGREIMKIEQVTEPFTIDGNVSIKRRQKTAVDADGNVIGMVSEKGNPIEDRVVFLPLKLESGASAVVASKSPLILQMFRSLPVADTQDFGKTAKLDIIDIEIEGKMIFTQGPYKYGSREIMVATLKEA